MGRMTRFLVWGVVLVEFGLLVPVSAKVDLVTLPKRDEVRLTVYNSADLTLARDRRDLTLREGENHLQFSWENTLIDPTSLDIISRSEKSGFEVAELIFPARTRELGIWKINSAAAQNVPVEISYFTSGISWRATYIATLSEDEKTMAIEGYVRIDNQSGEDYENAATRLVVGKINLLDRIADLARRGAPYGQPGQYIPVMEESVGVRRMRLLEAKAVLSAADDAEVPASIEKEGMSEYFLYTIAGHYDFPNSWGKRLLSLKEDAAKISNLFRFEEERFGKEVVRFIVFKNDEEHNLGEEPLPGGAMKVFQKSGDELVFAGSSNLKYIPRGEEVEVNLGVSDEVLVKPRLMNYREVNHMFDNDGNLRGWDEIRTFEVEVRNDRPSPARVEVFRNFPNTNWAVRNEGSYGRYEKYDLDTVKYTLDLEPYSSVKFGYEVTYFIGERADFLEKREGGQ